MSFPLLPAIIKADDFLPWKNPSLFLNELVTLHYETHIMLVFLFEYQRNVKVGESFYTTVNYLPIHSEIKMSHVGVNGIFKGIKSNSYDELDHKNENLYFAKIWSYLINIDVFFLNHSHRFQSLIWDKNRDEYIYAKYYLLR